MLMQDMTGVVDPLQILSHQFPMNLYILASTLDPVTTEPGSAAMNTHNSSFWPTINPTHTFATAPDDIEVLIVPGGPGVRAPDVSPMTDFIRDRYPKLRYLLTVCTGAGLAARSGVLDGRRATTNKKAWDSITAYGPNTTWVSPARWVVDGNIWTSSGVRLFLFHLLISFFVSGFSSLFPTRSIVGNYGGDCEPKADSSVTLVLGHRWTGSRIRLDRTYLGSGMGRMG
jgi:putative intracellular protease/amidase